MTPLAAREYFDLVIRHSFDVFVKQCFAELNPGTPYIENWHVEAIAHRLELCRAGESKRLIITVPPRSLKSLCASIAFPAFVLGHAPTQRLIIVTYSQELGSKFTMAFRRIVNSAWYQRIFPNTRALKETETEFVTTKGGERVSISIGGSLTGRGGNFIIIDDPLKADEAMSRAARERVNEYYGSTLFSRLDDKRCGVIVLVMQRLHEEDLAGQLLRGGGWWHLDLPAIAQEDACFELMRGRKHYRSHGDLLHPEREPWQILDEIKQTLGTYAFQAQYQQRPVSDAGNLVHRDWICYYDALPPRNTTSSIIQSWDTALKGEEMHDFSVCTTWLRQGNDHYLMDVARKHCDYPELRRLASQLHYQYKPDITLIEDRGNGSSLIADLWHFESTRAVGIKPEGDKQTRLAAVSPLIEQGSVLFPRRAPWLADLIDELLRFPQTKFDDQVDSLSQYLNWARLRARTTLFKVDWM